jgi:hypothetical protein
MRRSSVLNTVCETLILVGTCVLASSACGVQASRTRQDEDRRVDFSLQGVSGQHRINKKRARSPSQGHYCCCTSVKQSIRGWAQALVELAHSLRCTPAAAPPLCEDSHSQQLRRASLCRPLSIRLDSSSHLLARAGRSICQQLLSHLLLLHTHTCHRPTTPVS